VVIDPHVHRAKVSTAVHAMVLKNGRVRAIPELDIASNNVVAKHTVAIACPNPASIAYFASRGIDRGEAERVLAERLLCPISNLV
jgi:Fe-S cluster assembly scaffold protein SufB